LLVVLDLVISQLPVLLHWCRNSIAKWTSSDGDYENSRGTNC